MHRLTFGVLIVFLAAGCAAPWPEGGQRPLLVKRQNSVLQDPLTRSEAAAETGVLQVSPLPKAPLRVNPQKFGSVEPKADANNLEAAVSLQSIALPQFIEAVYATILKKNVSIDPQILQRTDLVSFKTGKPQTSEQLFVAARAVLRSFGVTVQEYDGLLRFLPENADSGYLPEIRRGRASPDVPESLRPVFYLVELEYNNVNEVASTIRATFQNKVTMQEDQARNSIMLSGQAANVSAAMEAIQVLDQPKLRGKIGVRIDPEYTNADELSQRLNRALQAEGVYSSTQAGANTPVFLMPVGAINAVFVFASNQATVDHVVEWARELDRSSKSGVSGGYFIYSARNVDAESLAKTLQAMKGGASVTPAAPGAATAGGSKIVVNPGTNSLIIQASPAEFRDWRDLLKELDRPARSALVTVTVASVSLEDTDNRGVGFQGVLQWAALKGLQFVVSTNSTGLSGAWMRTNNAWETSVQPGGSSSGSGWQTVSPSNPRGVIEAYAKLGRVNVLSNPSIQTRSGESATIRVGQEVPTITSTTSNISSGGTTQNSIQYRKTGVLLTVKPVVHSGGRIDLDISQEVSSTATTAGVSGSPVINTNNLDTKLTVADGETVVLGGLMQSMENNSNSGTPVLKDVPLFGGLFRQSESSVEKQELVMLVTAYAVEDSFDVRAVADAFKNKFPWSAPLYKEGGGNPRVSEEPAPAASSIQASKIDVEKP